MQCTSQYLLTGNFDGSVRFWKMPSDKNPPTFHQGNYLNAHHYFRNITQLQGAQGRSAGDAQDNMWE